MSPLPEGKLVLRHRRPMSHPFPNAYAHPLPTFSYSSETGEIAVGFTCDPTYPPPDKRSDAWKSKSYILTSIPMRKPKSIIDDATAFFSSAFSTTESFFSGRSSAPQATPDEVFDGVIDLGEDEVIEEERGEEAEIDDSLEPTRQVRMITLAERTRSDKHLSAKALNRRHWEILSLRRVDARTGK